MADSASNSNRPRPDLYALRRLQQGQHPALWRLQDTAWKKKSTRGNDYLSVELNSALLPAPVNCALIRQSGSSYALVWSRDTRSEGEGG